MCEHREEQRWGKKNDISSSIVHFCLLKVNLEFPLIGSSPEEMRKGKPSSEPEVNCFN